MIRRPPRSTLSSSSAASDVYKRQVSTQSTGERLEKMAEAMYSTTPLPDDRRLDDAMEPEEPQEEGDELPPFPEPLESYPKPPHPENRSHDFENVLAYMAAAKQANDRGELPPACGFGRYLGVNPQGQPQRYQSKVWSGVRVRVRVRVRQGQG
eukprot:TRINITY_DN9518_c0_g1_i2.p1 TRINITY_DN9518_c0_g1~~TRINITY_DN9518_c0_g1_i2.p1  ORF type:complete len:153 (+),score=36.24 TRINITY_DN9518_c0_g1_i2:95-553(+)